ncbi:unnamed protein product [Allacma fusca]|uniref:Apple domain-containing protein n=1 Tax=Allacma fusca TaxID=39272 RepID=A0A8J2PNT0_9HEXA|nr:unnamed protein product [Allacma fusca]
MRITLIIFAVGSLSCSSDSKCIQTMFGVTCENDQDCRSEKEHFLYCNKTENANKCAFNEQVYMGHVYENWDCPGQQFSAVPWGDPVPTQLAASGLDCMRLCLQIKTCFGISVRSQSCYLKNDICFNQNNLVRAPQTIIGVLRIVREDYRCGCHYPFERERMNGSVLEWYPVCPGVTPMNSLSVRYACCSKKGLCEEC